MDLETFEDIRNHLSLSNMGKPALMGIAVILVMVAVAAGRLLIGTATANDFELVKAGSPESSQVEPEASQDASTIFVHVSGAVMNPGLVEIASGSRVADAVLAADGFAAEAETGSVNLARVLEDGEQIFIAAKPAEGEGGPDAPASRQDSPGMTSYDAGLVNINTATAEELVSLPGIGESTASKIVADRQANGSYKTIEDLKRVSGIGDKKFEALSGLICV